MSPSAGPSRIAPKTTNVTVPRISPASSIRYEVSPPRRRLIAPNTIPAANAAMKPEPPSGAAIPYATAAPAAPAAPARVTVLPPDHLHSGQRLVGRACPFSDRLQPVGVRREHRERNVDVAGSERRLPALRGALSDVAEIR